MYQLDFSLLPTFEQSTAWMSLPEHIESALKALASTHGRARGALHFAYGVWNGYSHYGVKEREANLRASLAEFVSMEEALKRDLLPSMGRPILISSSSNPLLHVTRELRNLEIHLHSATLTSAQKNAMFAGENVQIQIWVADDITEAQFKQLRNSKFYSNADIKRMLNWFNASQKEWGIADLIFRSVCEYGSNIIAKYGL